MTADNQIIFNNQIIRQTANDHSARVNTLGWRIELLFTLIRLIMCCVFVLACVCVHFFKTVQQKGTRQQTQRPRPCRVLRNEEEVLKYYFLCSVSSVNTGSESVLLNPSALWCVQKSKHTQRTTHTHNAPHTQTHIHRAKKNKTCTSPTVSTPRQRPTFFHFSILAH